MRHLLALRQPGLRGRVVLSFAVGALLVSSALAFVTWVLSASYLQAQRTRIATSEAVDNAIVVRQAFAAGGVEPPEVLERVSSPTAEGMLNLGDAWFSSSLSLTPEDLPKALVAATRDGRSVRMRFDVDGRARIAVGIPLQDVDVAYFAVLPLDELDATLQTLSVVLLGGALATSGAGAVLGVWASRRALRPLTTVNAAAGAVAAGDLSVRLETKDPDLSDLASTFNATVALLAARVRRDARFAANVSHELRSPVTTLANAVAVLAARRHDMSATSATMVDTMAEEVTRFRKIVEDLLEISLDDAGRNVELERVRLDEVVRAALGDRSALLQVEPDASHAVVQGDRRRLERVVCNLVDNADAHGGGVTAVRLRRAATGLELAVDDAGPGVPVELRRDVFERFNRGKSRRETSDGVGLGLALVFQHVRLHSGLVHVEDSPEGGARFVVWMPVADPEDEPT